MVKKMNEKQRKEYEEAVHTWSDYIYSLNIEKLSKETMQVIGVSKSDYEKAKEAFYCRIKNGIILINESMPDWEIRRDLFLALDRLPHELLEDIYRMEVRRYNNEKPDLEGIEDIGEKVRRLLYFIYMPEIINAHKESDKKHI